MFSNIISESRYLGMTILERNNRYTEFTGVNGTLLRSATLGRQWMLQMGRATEAHNLSLQLCMAWPRHVLQSLEMPSVTQGRGSPDYNVKSEQVSGIHIHRTRVCMYGMIISLFSRSPILHESRASAAPVPSPAAYYYYLLRTCD